MKSLILICFVQDDLVRKIWFTMDGIPFAFRSPFFCQQLTMRESLRGMSFRFHTEFGNSGLETKVTWGVRTSCISLRRRRRKSRTPKEVPLRTRRNPLKLPMRNRILMRGSTIPTKGSQSANSLLIRRSGGLGPTSSIRLPR